MNIKIPCVVGPTAVGKTDYALQLAKKLFSQGAKGVDLVSVDSKQVFKGLEVLSGADVPQDWVQTVAQDLPPFYKSPDQEIFLHGVSIIEATEPWSLMDFRTFFWKLAKYLEKHGRKIIMVGGTGLYYQRTFDYDLPNVLPDEEIRKKAEQMTTAQLQEWLIKLDADALHQMNHSDQNNPRRLVRAIERNLSPSTLGMIANAGKPDTFISNYSPQYLGLTKNLKILEERITRRVANRFDQAKAEVALLQKSKKKLSPQAKSTIGFSQLISHLEGKLTKQTCQDLWAKKELQYAKRQLTWWKRHQVKWLETK